MPLTEPSRSLDAQVAREIYGYLVGKVIDQEEYFLGPETGPAPLYYHDDVTGERKLHNPVPYYSTNLELATDAFLKVCPKVTDRHPLYGEIFDKPAATLCYLALKIVRSRESR